MAEPHKQHAGVRLAARDIAVPAMASALIFASQVVMASLPNVEIVSLLFILYTIHLKRRTLFVIYVFALLEGLFYGFALWWVMYLYVWTILYFVVRSLTRRGRRHIAPFWAVIAGLYGLSFGFFCSFPYIAIGGFSYMIRWWIAGIPYDVMHGVWNFILTLVLFTPLDKAFRYILRN